MLNLIDTLCRNDLDLDVFIGEDGATSGLEEEFRIATTSLFRGPGIPEIEHHVDFTLARAELRQVPGRMEK